ncbi:MAG: CDP-alcohol phosphatidyltransferase family protein, partial [Eubacterium sp.]
VNNAHIAIARRVIMIMLAREFLVAGIRMAAATTGEVIAANVFGKAKTFLQMSTTGITFLILAIGEGPSDIDMTTPWLNTYCTIAFWIVGIITLLSGLVYAKDGWHLIKTK